MAECNRLHAFHKVEVRHHKVYPRSVGSGAVDEAEAFKECFVGSFVVHIKTFHCGFACFYAVEREGVECIVVFQTLFYPRSFAGFPLFVEDGDAGNAVNTDSIVGHVDSVESHKVVFGDDSGAT